MLAVGELEPVPALTVTSPVQCSFIIPDHKRRALFTPHAQRERGKVIDRGVHIYIFTPHAQRERGKVIDLGVHYIIGERREPLSRVFNDQPCDIYGGVRTYVQNASCYFSKLKLHSPILVLTYVTLAFDL